MVDLDCQVCGSLEPLFKFCENETGIAMKKEENIFHGLEIKRGLLIPGENMYNAGAIVFKHGIEIIKEWARQTITRNRFFIGDQQLLSRILFIQKAIMSDLPAIYNWRMDLGINSNALILHWLGKYKDYLQKRIEILEKQFFINLSLPE